MADKKIPEYRIIGILGFFEKEFNVKTDKNQQLFTCGNYL